MRYLVTTWAPPSNERNPYQGLEAYLNGPEISNDRWELVSVVDVSDAWGPKFMLTFKGGNS